MGEPQRVCRFCYRPDAPEHMCAQKHDWERRNALEIARRTMDADREEAQTHYKWDAGANLRKAAMEASKRDAAYKRLDHALAMLAKREEAERRAKERPRWFTLDGPDKKR